MDFFVPLERVGCFLFVFVFLPCYYTVMWTATSCVIWERAVMLATHGAIGNMLVLSVPVALVTFVFLLVFCGGAPSVCCRQRPFALEVPPRQAPRSLRGQC